MLCVQQRKVNPPSPVNSHSRYTALFCSKFFVYKQY